MIRRNKVRSTVAGIVAVAIMATMTAVSVGTAVAAKTPTVAVKLAEFKVKPKPTSAKAGDVRFKVTNKGGIEHEMVMVRGDAASLPLATDGSVDEDELPTSDAIGEVEEVDPKKTKSFTAKGLTPGTYTLFCNVVTTEGGTTLSHFAEGMHTTFTVR